MTQRVLIIKLPSLLRQIVSDALAVDGRAEVIEYGDDDGEENLDLIAAISQYEPDVIVTSSTGREIDPALDEYLSADDGRRVLAIERVGRAAYLFSMRPEPLALGEMSTDTLVHAIHDEFTEH